MYIGLDIGGTKCAVISADDAGTIKTRVAFPTMSVGETMARFYEEIDRLVEEEAQKATDQPAGSAWLKTSDQLAEGATQKTTDQPAEGAAQKTTDQPAGGAALKAIGISCGGPLDEKRGLIQSPPNLPGWDEIPIVRDLEARYHVPTHLRNDANACALAEWKFGAGQGTENMVFLTFGTGMGAGLILDGRLYSGTNGNAGEVGHMRLENEGPVGYRKKGSFEGFCSGGGIARLAQEEALKSLKNGVKMAFCEREEDLPTISAKTVAEAAKNGDETALRIYDIVGEKLGKGLAVIIDLFNPERIVIGSIFERSGELMRARMMEVLKEEALPQSLAVCEIVPAKLGDHIGDVAAIAAAMEP